jgi:hypothetical protein
MKAVVYEGARELAATLVPCAGSGLRGVRDDRACRKAPAP